MKAISTIQAKQKGFSLVELLLVLGVIALIAIAAFIIYPSVQAGTQANTESSNITAIVAGTKNLYGAKGSYSGVNNVIGCQAHIFPSTMTGGATGAACTTATVSSSWGAVTLSSAAPNTSFEIEYAAIPTEACIKFLSGVAANFDTVSTAAGGTGTVVKASGKAPDPAQIVAACNLAPTNDIYFDSK